MGARSYTEAAFWHDNVESKLKKIRNTKPQANKFGHREGRDAAEKTREPSFPKTWGNSERAGRGVGRSNRPASKRLVKDDEWETQSWDGDNHCRRVAEDLGKPKEYDSWINDPELSNPRPDPHPQFAVFDIAVPKRRKDVSCGFQIISPVPKTIVLDDFPVSESESDRHSEDEDDDWEDIGVEGCSEKRGKPRLTYADILKR